MLWSPDLCPRTPVCFLSVTQCVEIRIMPLVWRRGNEEVMCPIGSPRGPVGRTSLGLVRLSCWGPYSATVIWWPSGKDEAGDPRLSPSRRYPFVWLLRCLRLDFKRGSLRRICFEEVPFFPLERTAALGSKFPGLISISCLHLETVGRMG